MWKNKYKKIKYSKSYGIGFGGYLSAVIGIVSIARKMNGYEKYTDVGIAIASIGVLSAITISYITSESRKISDLVRYFIISNEFYQVYTDENGKEKVEYFPCVEQKYDDDNIYVRFRIDGSKIGQKLRNQEQALADCFETLCIDVIDERGYITYVLQKNKEEQIVVHSIEELPQPEMGYLQVGNTLIDWMNCLVLCQEKVQIKCNQFSLCLAKLNLLFLSHYLLDFSDILPHIGLGINTRNGCEYVLYCKMFLCIQKSTYMHVYN